MAQRQKSSNDNVASKAHAAQEPLSTAEMCNLIEGRDKNEPLRAKARSIS